MTHKHLIIGCGDLGQRLARHLIQSGDRVVGLRRSPEDLPPWISTLKADILNSSKPEIVSGYHCIFIIISPSKNGYDQYLQTIKNTARLLQQTQKPPRRLIYVSSTRVYSQNNGEWVHEKTPVQASDPHSALLIQAENEIKRISRHIIVRFSGLYTRQTLLNTQKRLGVKEISTSQYKYTNRIHRTDAARFLAHVSQQRQSSAGSVYLCSDDSPVLQSDYYHWLAEQINVPVNLTALNTEIKGKRCNNRSIKASGFQLMYPDFQAAYFREQT